MKTIDRTQGADQYRYSKRWRLERARGITRLKDAAKTVAQIETLRAKGWSLRGIAEASGTSVQSLSLVANGKQKNVHRDTETAVLALREEDIFTRSNIDGFVPNIGARRRLQALMAIGYRHSDLSPLVGFSTGTMNHQVGDWISKTKHDAMKRVYDELWQTPGPAPATSLARVAKAGYLPPLAWDDDTIDDPNHVPVLTVERGERRESNKEIFVEEVLFLRDSGANRWEIARRLGMDWHSVERRLERYERHDLIKVIPAGEAA